MDTEPWNSGHRQVHSGRPDRHAIRPQVLYERCLLGVWRELPRKVRQVVLNRREIRERELRERERELERERERETVIDR